MPQIVSSGIALLLLILVSFAPMENVAPTEDRSGDAVASATFDGDLNLWLGTPVPVCDCRYMPGCSGGSCIGLLVCTPIGSTGFFCIPLGIGVFVDCQCV